MNERIVTKEKDGRWWWSRIVTYRDAGRKVETVSRASCQSFPTRGQARAHAEAAWKEELEL